jgi:hypothetical protein
LDSIDATSKQGHGRLGHKRKSDKGKHTIFPEAKINAVVFGSLILMITAAKRLGLYSAFLACKAMALRSSLQSKFTVETIF